MGHTTKSSWEQQSLDQVAPDWQAAADKPTSDSGDDKEQKRVVVIDDRCYNTS